MEELVYKIWFSKLEISNKIKLKLLADFGNCKNIWSVEEEELKRKGYGDNQILNIFDNNYKKNLENELKYLVQKNVKLLNIYDEEFPKKLLQISDCPSQIYVRGDINKLYDDNVAIIGSRKASLYGKDLSRNIAKDFAKLEINVVSGLAIGIDKFAHLGALDVPGGRTIAVLGSGISESVFYPSENYRVYERILSEGGVIVSEYPIFAKPNSYHFPARNRIISGLSEKVIVVEAGEKSGSLITVEFALEQGKDVFAVPGDITKFNSKGTNKLIQEGASIFLSINDCFI